MQKRILDQVGAESLLSRIDAAPTDAEQGFQPRVVVNPPDHIMERVYRIRTLAWQQQATLTAASDRWTETWDACSYHYVLMIEDEPVGAFRFSLHASPAELPNSEIYGSLLDHLPAPVAWFSRLVIHPDFQGKGYSRQLDSLALSEPLSAGAASVVATGGSVIGNLTRHAVMLRRGWTDAGVTLGAPKGEHIADHNPRVFYKIYDAG
ncbi:MAG: GNAT family N-acetyltransferase [Sphingomonas sp.]|uniref:GNAT family N-acetyltransferase n=1 Tax=Sphingomonas sp. TaxID=28214 RepID=UPI0018200502|nr:GNAT family N-acetyltransferase [Sphingomonas sp.]